jgi:cell division septum initiation protein DivIVA
MGSIDEEKKNAVRKLTREKDDLKQENEILKRKVQEFEKLGRGEQSSARSSVCFLI